MRIGMILDGPFPPDSRVENEAVSLIGEGHAVFLYCLDYQKTLPEKEMINGIEVRRYSPPAIMYKFSALAYTVPVYHWHMKKSIMDFLDVNHIQIIHCHDIQISRAVFLANRKFQLPVVQDLHENRPEIMKYYTHVSRIPGRLFIYPSLWKKFEYRYIKKADRVIVVTKEAKEYYVKNVPSQPGKFSVVPNTVRKEFYTGVTPDSALMEQYRDYFTILYLGETGFRRGIETMIRSLKYLVPEIPEIKMVIVGKSRADNYYKELTGKLGFREYLDFRGWQDVSKFPSYIQVSDIGVSPIHRNLHHDTTYANKIFMYMSLGLPMLVSDCPAQANVVIENECGLVHEAQNVKDFAEKVLALYRDKRMRKRFSENSRKAIEERLNWNQTSVELKQLYADYDRKRV